MKKIISLLLILCLLLTGCATSAPSGVGKTFPDGSAASLDGGSPYYCDLYKVSGDLKAVLHDQTVFFEHNVGGEAFKPQVYCASLTEERQPTLFFNGQLIGIFKNTLIVCDDEAYYAIRLDQKNNREKLAPAAYTVTTVLQNDTLFLFGVRKFEGYNGKERFIDRIDLSTLEWTREDNDTVIIDTLAADGLVYYLRYAEDSSEIFFCVADQTDQKETLLKTIGVGLKLYQANGKIFCDTRDGTDFLYDPKTKAFETPEENRKYFDGGSFKKDESNSKGSALYHFRLQDGTEYTADLTYRGAGGIVVANSFGAAFIAGTNVCFIDWETKTIKQYYPEDFTKQK